MSASPTPQQSASAPTTLSKATTKSPSGSGSPQQQPSAAQGSYMSTVKSKKDASKPSNSTPPISMPVSSAPTTKSHTQDQMKKVSRRASKPIINWFQRKLAGTVRTRRASESQRYGASSPRGKEKQHRRSSVPMPPPLAVHSRTRSNTASSRQNKAHSLRGTISLNETMDETESRSFGCDSDDELRLSVARQSLYSPASYLEADEDASVRPLPPSSPPSPSPSRSSSSYLSHSRTFRSMTASTKPTTLLSIDLNGGMAHIAQAPPTPTTPSHRISPHVRTHSSGPSAGSITFSAIPPPSPTSPFNPSPGGAGGVRGASLTAPLYTTHHPRNNPRPSSPPPDDASMLTLASSAFGMPGARMGAAAFGLSGRTSIADDSISQWSNAAGMTDSASHFMMGDLEGGMEEERYDHDVDASVRALRPRSSRRNSWESTVSKWSANVAPGAPSPGGMRSKSLWTSGSYRTGGISTEDGFMGTQVDEEQESKMGEETEVDSTANQTNDTESSAPTDKQEPSMSTIAPSTDAEEETKAPMGEANGLGTKAHASADIAPTMTLPGSKKVTWPEDSSVSGNKSGASTPTKTESVDAELSTATESLKLEESEQYANGHAAKDDSRRSSIPLSPLSPTGTTHSEYVSAPSTPAAF